MTRGCGRSWLSNCMPCAYLCVCRRLKPLAFLRTLAFHIAVRVPAVRPYYLETSFDGVALSSDVAGQAFNLLLQQPLTQHEVSAGMAGLLLLTQPCIAALYSSPDQPVAVAVCQPPLLVVP